MMAMTMAGRDRRGVRLEDCLRAGARPVRDGLHRREQGGEGVWVREGFFSTVFCVTANLCLVPLLLGQRLFMPCASRCRPWNLCLIVLE